MSHHTAEEIDKRVRQFFLIGASLLILTGLTVAVAYLHLGVVAAVTVALIIACFKASLVAAIFMHLIAEEKLIYAVLLMTVAFFFVLLFVPLLTDWDGFGS